MIGFDRDPRYARLLEERVGIRFSSEMFAFRSDSELAQLAALRAGIGVGVCQTGIARKDKNLVPVLHAKLLVSLEVWLAMHRDLRGNRRIRMTFDGLATQLTSYVSNSHSAG
jgi:DNA-binding transcriptional LysR family regulator